MKYKYSALLLIFFLISCQPKSQNHITINIPTAESEAEYIWQTIQDIHFFEENNYQVSLPEGALMDELKQKSKSGDLTDNDYERLEDFIKNNIYNKANYQKGFEKIKKEMGLINKMIDQLHQLKLNWNFKFYKTYQIDLTLYGPGGSYNPDDGSILVFTTRDGKFKNYDNPANTIIHEVAHIGIEESIISKYDVPHPLKERIVDTFVSLNFSQLLPDYRIQDMGETRSDYYLKTIDDIKDLNILVKNILADDVKGNH